MMTWGFRPVGATVNATAASTTSNVALTTGSYRQVRVANSGTVTAFLNWGESSAVTAVAATSIPLLAGEIEVFSPPAGTTYAAVITSSGTATIYFTGGEGL